MLREPGSKSGWCGEGGRWGWKPKRKVEVRLCRINPAFFLGCLQGPSFAQGGALVLCIYPVHLPSEGPERAAALSAAPVPVTAQASRRQEGGVQDPVKTHLVHLLGMTPLPFIDLEEGIWPRGHHF